MSWVVAILAIVVAWNPALFTERAPSTSPERKRGWLIASGVLMLAAAGVDPVLDLLDVSTPTFRTAAGAVVALGGARWLIGPPPPADGGNQLGHGLMDVASPEIVAATLAAATTGWPLAVTGVAAALATTAAMTSRAVAPQTSHWLRRLLAGGAVAAGIVLVYVGVRAV